jgi:hypothetical protein
MLRGDASYGLNAPDIIAESVDGEVLIINLRDGTYYSADGTGGLIWDLVVAHGSLDDIVARLSASCTGAPSDIRRAVQQFVAELEEEDLIVPHPRDELPPASPEPSSHATFEAPTLHKYTDFQELLRLDPIHDADHAAGWPGVKTSN